MPVGRQPGGVSTHLLPGTPYRLLRKLDEGGMAELYVAEHTRLGREEALKFLTAGANGDPDAAERLRREARALARLSNPHIVEIHTMDISADGRLYLAMRLVGGENLRRHARRRGAPFPADEAWALLRPVAMALQEAHDVGIVHRDLKPQNIMVEPRPGGLFPVLLDFGVALSQVDAAERLTRRGQLFGTPNYMAPEQIAGEPVDGRADQHALAIVLYNMLCGRFPHEGDSPLQVIACKMMKPAMPLAGRAPGVVVAPTLDAAIMRAISRAAEDRFPTMRDFVAAVDEAVARPMRPQTDAANQIPGSAWPFSTDSNDLDSSSDGPTGDGADGTLAGESEATLAGLTSDASIVPGAPATGYLPAERDRFIGRVDDLRALREVFYDDARVVTLLGIGGTGKTRLSLRFAGVSASEWHGGVWFCDLSDANDEAAIIDRVAAIMGVPLLRGSPGEQLALAIAGRGETLLILDNLEQIVGPVRRVLGGFLDAAPQARFLLTSRERLGLEGEHVMALGPLTPADAEALFLRRARAAKHDFELAPDDGPVVTALCELLDRLPLALELAAARVRLWSPRGLLERMTDRFRLLTGGTGRPDRQATLRKALDWSWDLLDTAERGTLAQLSVFRGGFDVDAVEAIVDAADGWAADRLQALVDKSLVRGTAGERFELLQTVQAYAADRLTGDTSALETRHGRFYAALGEAQALAKLRGPEAAAHRAHLRADMSNLLVAHTRAVTRKDAPVAAACARAAWAIMEDEGPCLRAAEMLDATLCIGPLPHAEDHATRLALGMAHRLSGHVAGAETCLRSLVQDTLDRGADADRGRALLALGALLADRARFPEARTAMDAARPLLQSHGDHASLAQMTSDMARVLWESNATQAAEVQIREGLALAQQMGDRGREGILLGHLVLVTSLRTSLSERIKAVDEAIAVHREVGNQRAEAAALNNRGQWCVALGRLSEARNTYNRAMTIHRQVGHRMGEAISLGSLARVFVLDGQPAIARMGAAQALPILAELGSRQYESLPRWVLAEAAIEEGQLDEALAQLEATDIIRRDLGPRPEDGMLANTLGGVLLLQGQLAQAEPVFRSALSTLAKSDDGALHHVHAMYRLATLLVSLGRRDEARSAYLGVAEQAVQRQLRPESPLIRLREALAIELA